MKITEPKFCHFCKEMVYSRLCPYCEQPAGEFDLDPKDDREIQVNEGGDVDFQEDGLVALNFDDLYGAESDD